MTDAHLQSTTDRRAAVVFVLLVTVGSGLGWRATEALADAIESGAPAPRASCSCLDGRDPGRVSDQLRVAWQKAFEGERPDNADLAAYQDATEILDCLSASEADDPRRKP